MFVLRWLKIIRKKALDGSVAGDAPRSRSQQAGSRFPALFVIPLDS
jgi:hypothetical protein